MLKKICIYGIFGRLSHNRKEKRQHTKQKKIVRNAKNTIQVRCDCKLERYEISRNGDETFIGLIELLIKVWVLEVARFWKFLGY